MLFNFSTFEKKLSTLACYTENNFTSIISLFFLKIIIITRIKANAEYIALFVKLRRIKYYWNIYRKITISVSYSLFFLEMKIVLLIKLFI